jgi:hypothetical protein
MPKISLMKKPRPMSRLNLGIARLKGGFEAG